jgi:hypothetical protein
MDIDKTYLISMDDKEVGHLILFLKWACNVYECDAEYQHGEISDEMYDTMCNLKFMLQNHG